MDVHEVVPLLNIKDMPQSIAFYVDGLGFEITNGWRVEGELKWCRLQLDGAGLMVQQVATQFDGVPGAGPPGAGSPGGSLVASPRAPGKGYSRRRGYRLSQLLFPVSIRFP